MMLNTQKLGNQFKHNADRYYCT